MVDCAYYDKQTTTQQQKRLKSWLDEFPKKENMAKELQPIIGKHLLSFPEDCPAPFELWVKDGFNLALFNPDGDMVLVSKKEFLGILIKLYEKSKISEQNDQKNHHNHNKRQY